MADMCTHTGTPTTERGNLKSAHGGSKFSLTVLPSTMNFARRPSTFYLRVCKTGPPALPDPPGLCRVCSGRAHGGGTDERDSDRAFLPARPAAFKASAQNGCLAGSAPVRATQTRMPVNGDCLPRAGVLLVSRVSFCARSAISLCCVGKRYHHSSRRSPRGTCHCTGKSLSVQKRTTSSASHIFS